MQNIKVDNLNIAEKREVISLLNDLNPFISSRFSPDETEALRKAMRNGMQISVRAHNSKGLPTAILTLRTALCFAQAIEPDHDILLAIGIYPILKSGMTDILAVRREWGEGVAGLLTGMEAVDKFSNKNNAVNQDNFRGLMLALADVPRATVV